MKRAMQCLFAVSTLLTAHVAPAMTAQPTRLAVWARGETISGEEFIAANEGIVDYLGTLRRPTGTTERLLYDCMAKSRLIRPSIITIGGTDPVSGYAEVRMVYELTDCRERPAN